MNFSKKAVGKRFFIVSGLEVCIDLSIKLIVLYQELLQEYQVTLLFHIKFEAKFLTLLQTKSDWITFFKTWCNTIKIKK